jgi:serine/threonine protein kinase
VEQAVLASVRWTAPELFDLGRKKSRSSDVYAFGITIVEVGHVEPDGRTQLSTQIYTGKRPYPGYNHSMQVIMDVCKGIRPGRPAVECGFNNALWELVNYCWDADSHSRPDMKEVVKSVSDSSLLIAK